MAKQIVRGTKRPATRAKRRVEVSDGVRIVMAGLDATERAVVEAGFRSFTALRALPLEAVVESPTGTLYVARVTPSLCLVYRLDADGARVVDLLNVETIRNYVHPGWLVRNAAKRATRRRAARTKPVPKRPTAT